MTTRRQFLALGTLLTAAGGIRTLRGPHTFDQTARLPEEPGVIEPSIRHP
ncbi:twin-arginine translocation signal domain-containing protein [Haloplanus sp. C73]